MTLEFILLICLAQHFRRSLQTSTELPIWDKVLIGFILIAVVSIVLQISFPGAKSAIMWLAHLLLVLVVYITFKEKDFKPVRSRMYAVLPFIVISFVSDFFEKALPRVYRKWDDYFDTGVLFALLWMFVMWQVGNRQRKALEKERIKTREREAQISVASTLKQQLEIQVAERTAELTFQKEELEHALNELKATQAQLIQSEKMASLGELTAGIAHEIQNPLNFVNNFSEVSIELLEEMKDELNNGNAGEAIAIAQDIEQNLQKITFHGRRADGIVKGMLQHSRASSGTKEPADINALADEYLRLSYHGLRAKDKSFNAQFITDFDETVGSVDVVPQDLGRVFLNLYNNAFYAVNEKKKQLNGSFNPVVSVSTRKKGNKVEISVKDNGNGMSKQVTEKILQPFFTTKPTGQGTGLGLSLSYDIVTKGHGGELKVNTEEGAGAEFVVILPA